MTETKHGIDASFNDRLNILRAQVLTVPMLAYLNRWVIGVASVSGSSSYLVSLPFWLELPSMAGGEYVSVSTQKGYRRSRCESG